eukprot:m.153861 g.153861  ORF g.153861 m.153861 type:complete len:698 (+) comp23475_c0_seq2:76-2169(+)
MSGVRSVVLMVAMLMSVARVCTLAAQPHRATTPGPVRAKQKKMNVLMIAADDLRPQLGCYQPEGWAGRHVEMHTPNIDALANRSVVFLRSYCQQAICGPTRASLLTGRRPDTTNVHTIGPYWRTVGGNFTSLPQHFKQSGYTTVGHGKIFHPGSSSGGTASGYVNPGPAFPWVLGDDYPYAWTTDDPELSPYYHAPNKMYWQCSAAPGYNTTCPGGGMGHRETPSYATVNASLEAEVPLMDDQIATQAVKTLGILKGRPDTPWFVGVGFHLPHLPDLVPQRFVDLYPNPVDLPDNQFAPNHMPLVAWSSSGELREQYSDARALGATGAVNTTLPANFTVALRRHYYGAVSYLDYQVGRVLTALSENNQEENTIVALWGDHGYQLGEHGIWCKVTNFELATHTALIISWPGMGKPGRSTSFVEFVDIFPTLSDLAGIAVPPLCPPNSSHIELCTEGVSLKPIFFDETAEVKTASFSQYPHGPHGVLTTKSSSAPPCPPTATGRWLAINRDSPRSNNLFVLNVRSNGEVSMDTSGCSDCSFSSAIGSLTATGVNLTLRFAKTAVTDFQVGTLMNNSCQLVWTTNSSDTSGHWAPFFRDGHAPPTPPAPPPANSIFMGYTMITRVERLEYRYTEWPLWLGSASTKGSPNWADLAGVELYNHSADPEENENIVGNTDPTLLSALSKQLRAGWRAAHIPTPT